MVKYLRVRKWDEFQQYKDREPKWIKLYRSLNRNYEWCKLDDSARAHLIGIWLLAAELDNKIPNDPKWIAAQISATTEVQLNQLCTKGFLEPYDCVQKRTEAYPETETETETECSLSLAQDARARGESGWNGFDPEETLQTLSRQALGYSATIGECRKWSRGFFETTGNPDEFRKLARRFFDAVKSRAPTNPGAYISSVAANPREFVSGKTYKPTATAEPYLGRSAWTPPQYTAEQLASVAESVKRVKAAVKGDTDAERGRARLAAVEAEVKQGADADLLRAALAKEAR